jgi:hypothetical protein
MRTLILAALTAIGLSLAQPSAASAQGVYDPNTGQYYQYFTPYSNAAGTTYFYPGRSTATYIYPFSPGDWFVQKNIPPRNFGSGDIATYSPLFRGTNTAPYVTDYTSWYSPYRRTWHYGR